jgi:hypothetical protein
LNEGNNEKGSQIQPTPALKRSNKPINHGEKKRKTTRYSLNGTFLVFHCYKKRGHYNASCWYTKACSYRGKKGHHEASCWEKQDMCHMPKCFQRNGRRTSPIQQQTQRHIERRTMTGSPCSNDKNFFHHYPLSGSLEVKFWQLHQELHPRNFTSKRRAWKVKPNRHEGPPVVQRAEAIQGAITT